MLEDFQLLIGHQIWCNPHCLTISSWILYYRYQIIIIRYGFNIKCIIYLILIINCRHFNINKQHLKLFRLMVYLVCLYLNCYYLVGSKT